MLQKYIPSCNLEQSKLNSEAPSKSETFITFVSKELKICNGKSELKFLLSLIPTKPEVGLKVMDLMIF